MAARRVLITGGAGFLGGTLARALLADGQEVHLLVRPGTDRRRLDGRCAAYEADLCDAAAVRRAVAACRPEVVYHLGTYGWQAGPKDAGAIRAANGPGTAHLLAALQDQPYRALVHAGTGLEYGPHDGPVGEGAPLRPPTEYAAAKAAASRLCLAERARGRPVVVVRVFAAYGPGEAPGRLVPYLMRCCLRGEVPRVSAGAQRRDFIHADDVIALFRAAAARPRESGPVLHAGTGVEHSVREMVAAVLAACGRPDAPVVFGAAPLRPGEPEHYLADIAGTHARTGWAPRLDLRAGLARTWDWFRAAHAEAA
jgi:nucleoside-diphosphate-sugar epimerase